ncbi:hypothetical protein [Nocardiopsis sp. LOL_012]|uniref:hypothetical protein n=1 Tax=Nocardiopsis sp. LOL_012 TaxID=3345409 RepID=UPI003A86863E
MPNTTVRRAQNAHRPAPVAVHAPSPALRKRPQGVMKGIGFITDLWITDALKSGFFTSSRAYTLASIIADATDPDGRWCFLRIDTIAARTCGVLSTSTVTRAIAELVATGLVRRLSREQVRAFFAADLAAGRRWSDRLPEVLELLIPAREFPEPVLEEINAVRRDLGEEPITEANRPYRPVGTPRQSGATPRQSAADATSNRAAYPSPTDPCPKTPAPTSVRRRPAAEHAPAPSGGTAPPPLPAPRAPEGSAWARGLVAPVPDGALGDRPDADRAFLAARLDALRAAGVPAGDLAGAVRGWESVGRPFPALRARLASADSVRAWNRRALGAGAPPPRTRTSHPFGGLSLDAAAGPAKGIPDAFALGFDVDARGRAPRTCPDHPSLYNTPGESCVVCGRRCRTVPGEVMDEPRPVAPPGKPVPEPRMPKCGDERCVGDPDSERYRMVIGFDAVSGRFTVRPCPACGTRSGTGKRSTFTS